MINTNLASNNLEVGDEICYQTAYNGGNLTSPQNLNQESSPGDVSEINSDFQFSKNQEPLMGAENSFSK